tara:strand:+ start:18652 stop:18876 length:225 start_codon:yes stop_codon:yes gene_type:complete
MAESKITKVMKEFKTGDLKSGSGDKVTSPKQAMAIAISEQEQIKKMSSGSLVGEPKTIARGSGAARTQYFRKNG